jgi:hypothetical protein
MPEGVKKEYRIDSSDSARPPATLDSETAAFAQGLKAKPRVIVDVTYEALEGQFVSRGKDTNTGRERPPAKLILKTTTYDDGMTIDKTVGEDNPDYLDFLQGVENSKGSAATTRRHQPKRKPDAPKGKGKS